MPRTRWTSIAALVCVLAASATTPAQAQHVSSDSTLIRNIKLYADSISRRTGVNTITHTRLVPAIKLRADSVLRNPIQRDTLYVTRTDTVVVHDTIAPPVPSDTAKDSVIVTPGTGGQPVLFAHPYALPSNGALLAELPRDTVPIDVPTPTRTIPVVSLQAAFDTAQTGDRLLIPRNHTTNRVWLRPTARASWVTIQGTDSTSVIETTVGGAESAVNIASGAHHIRFLGPLTMRAATDATNAIFRSYNAETAISQLAHHIVLDGVTITSNGYEVRRCAWPDGAYMAIVNSRLLGCASRSGDAQGIIIGNGTGPYRFEGNYIEGGHQCFMSGGFDESLPVGTLPSDVVFRNNVCFKPLEWHYTLNADGSKNYTGVKRQVKTGIETKYIRRALFEYNLIWNVWADAQAGFCGLLKSTNQSGSQTWAQTVDVTFRYNRCRHVAGGVNFAAHPQGGITMTRTSVYDNVFEDLSEASGEGIGFQILDDLVDLIVVHNTFSNTGNNAIGFDAAPGVRTVIDANVIPRGQYGVKGSGTASGNATITKWMPDGLFTRNVIVGGDCSLYPATTTCTLPAPVGIGADTTKAPR